MHGPHQSVLGIDGGGSKTAWVLAEWDGRALRVTRGGKLPPANLRLTSTARLREILEALPTDIARLGIFLAGCVTGEDRRELAALASSVWPDAKIVAGSDRESGVEAALGDGDGIAVNAGTGSSITGRRGARIEKAGGWGHVLGDAGGGYYLSVQALQLILREHDLHRGETEFAAGVLRELALNNLDELVRWAQTANKTEIAMLTPVVFAAADSGDRHVIEILHGGARVLAEYTTAVAHRLGFSAPEVRLLGGLFQCCTVYVEAYRRELRALAPNAVVAHAAQTPELAAATLALKEEEAGPEFLQAAAVPRVPGVSIATEQANPRSVSLDEMTATEIVALFVSEEQFVEGALRAQSNNLARAIDFVTAALRAGGRLFYVGAGSSGRLGVLDASEIRPTFGASSELVQGIIAGGATALFRSAEGAEDERESGALTIVQRGIRAGDVVCGIAASGSTPFVFGALTKARERDAGTVLLTCNPDRQRTETYDVEIDLPTGPELLTGSTRLKAGTATKVALNIISTGAMVRLGKVRGHSMVDLQATSRKLRDRAARLVSEQLGCEMETAVARLKAADWNVRAALDRGNHLNTPSHLSG